MGNEVASQSPRMFTVPDATPFYFAEEEEVFNEDPMHRQETLELVKAYYKIANRGAAKHLFDLVVSMSKTNFNKEENK